MKLKQETEGAIKLTVALLIAAALVIIAFVCGSTELLHGMDASGTTQSTGGLEQQATETAPGMPLDAIQYAAPTWMPDARQVFEVTDRKNNAKWWVMQVPSNGGYAWLVLPIGEYQDAG